MLNYGWWEITQLHDELRMVGYNPPYMMDSGVELGIFRHTPMLDGTHTGRMPNYRRLLFAGHTYFFTVNLAQRRGNDLLIRHIESLRGAFTEVKRLRPFTIHAVAVLPEHLHYLWQLPEGDFDYSTRWRLIKSEFSKRIAHGEDITKSRLRKGERGIWQRRYWEHHIRDEQDFIAHVNYIHNNPVKHGYVRDAKDWPYSSIHKIGPGTRRVGYNPPPPQSPPPPSPRSPDARNTDMVHDNASTHLGEFPCTSTDSLPR